MEDDDDKFCSSVTAASCRSIRLLIELGANVDGILAKFAVDELVAESFCEMLEF